MFLTARITLCTLCVSVGAGIDWMVTVWWVHGEGHRQLKNLRDCVVSKGIGTFGSLCCMLKCLVASLGVRLCCCVLLLVAPNVRKL